MIAATIYMLTQGLIICGAVCAIYHTGYHQGRKDEQLLRKKQ